jgi:hypothetical protein
MDPLYRSCYMDKNWSPGTPTHPLYRSCYIGQCQNYKSDYENKEDKTLAVIEKTKVIESISRSLKNGSDNSSPSFSCIQLESLLEAAGWDKFFCYETHSNLPDFLIRNVSVVWLGMAWVVIPTKWELSQPGRSYPNHPLWKWDLSQPNPSKMGCIPTKPFENATYPSQPERPQTGSTTPDAWHRAQPIQCDLRELESKLYLRID